MTYRVGLIVPSSNTTMEVEVPAILSRHPESFSFHSSRMRMQHVTPAELTAMDAESHRCAVELADARCDVQAYACLIAIMAQGKGYHRASEVALAARALGAGGPAPVVSSAGALVDGLHALGARTAAVLTPYVPALTGLVVDYLENEDITVVSSHSLGVSDNLDVGRLDPVDLLDHCRRLDVDGADAVVLSACVQMPSLPVVDRVQDLLGKPVITASVATAWKVLRALDLDTDVPGAGALLAGAEKADAS